MKYEDAKQSLKILRDYITSAEMLSVNTNELSVKKAQLRAIEKTINQLEKKSVPVPEALYSEIKALTSDIKESNIHNTPSLLYEELLDIITQIGHVLGKKPHKELYLRSKEWRKKTTSKSIWRPSIIELLKAMEGSGSERDVFDALEQKYQGQFTPADIEKPFGRSARWETNVRSERNRMIRDGILTQDSRRKRWTLVK
jgi:hypothetical protein